MFFYEVLYGLASAPIPICYKCEVANDFTTNGRSVMPAKAAVAKARYPHPRHSRMFLAGIHLFISPGTIFSFCLLRQLASREWSDGDPRCFGILFLKLIAQKHLLFGGFMISLGGRPEPKSQSAILTLVNISQLEGFRPEHKSQSAILP